MDFEEFIEFVKENGHKLECPFGCEFCGYLCSGNPYETPCGNSILIDKDGNEVSPDDLAEILDIDH